MSNLGDNLPPRDSSGRFVRRSDIPPLLSSAETVIIPLPIPGPASPDPSPLSRLSSLPSDNRCASFVPFSESHVLEPRTPSPDYRAPPTTPERPAVYIQDNEAPLLALNFSDLDSKGLVSSLDSDSDSFLAIPSRAGVTSRHRSTSSTDSTPSSRPLLLARPPIITTHNAPRRSTLMSQPALPRSGTGPAAMPPPRSSRAPHFSGAVDDRIEDFLKE
jgi:hypothetical protein